MNPIIRKTLWIGGGATGGAALLLLLLILFGNTGIGQRTVEWIVPKVTDGQVTLRGLDGRFPDRLRVTQLELRDGKGLWLTAEDVALDWAPLAYLWSIVRVENVTARRVDVLRRPVSEESGEGSSPHIEIEALKIGRLNVSAAVAWRAASVTLSGKLDYASLDDARIDIAAQRLDAPGIYRVNADISRAGISGRVDIREPANGLIGGLTDLPDMGPLSVQAEASGPRKAQAIVLVLTAGAVRANARGTIDLAARTAQLDLSAQAPAMTPGPELSWASLALEGHLRGSFTKPDIAGNLSITQLKAGGGAARMVKAGISGQDGSAKIAASLDGLRIDGLPDDFFATAPVTLQANLRFDVRDTPIDFQLSHALATMRGHATLGGDVKGTATLDIRTLAPFAALAGLDLEGSAHATATLDTKSAKTAATLDGTLNLGGGDAVLAGLIGRHAKFGFAGYAEGKDIAIERARIDGAYVALSASGGLRDGVLAIGWTGALRDLSRVAHTLSGNLSLRGQVKGPEHNFEIAVAGEGSIAGGKSKRGPVRLAAKIAGLPDTPQGRISAEGRINGGALQFVADLERRNGRALSVRVIKGDWKSLRLHADLLLPRGADLPSGKVSLQAGQLGDLRPFLGFDVSGNLSAAAELRTGKTVHLNLAAKALTVQGVHADALSLDGTIADPIARAVTDMKLAATGIEANGIGGDLKAQIKGRPNALNLIVQSDLLDAGGNTAHVAGAARIDAFGQQLELEALDAAYRGEKAHLISPARFDLEKGIAVNRLHLAAAGAEADIAGRLLPSLSVTVSVKNMTSRLFRLFVPSLELEGALSAEASLSGTLAAPRGTVSLRGTGLRLQGSASAIGKGELAATAALNGQSAAVDARLSAGKTLSLTVAGTAPLTPDGNIDLKVKGNADLALFDPLLNVEGRTLRGIVNLDGTVTGTQMLPRVEGTANLSGGDFQDYVQGVHIAGISARFTAQGNRIAIDEIKGRAGKGTVSASGSIDLWGPGMPVNLTIDANNARLLAGNLMTMDGDAALKLSGQLASHIKLSGTVRIDDGEVNLPETLPRNVAVLDVRSKGQKSAPPRKRKAPAIGLNVTVTSPGRLFVRGRGLEAEVSGRVQVEGTTARPQMRGGFTMRRGELSIAGQTLNFTSGHVGFDGASVSGSLDPSLNFVAESTSGSVTAKLEVAGHASAPKIRLSSTPYLPQDEVLAHLLFQQSVKELGPLQLAQIAEGLGSLTGIGGGLNPLSRVRKGLGLDRLAVGGGQNGTGASVEAGKYVMNGVYVGAKQDTQGGTRAQVQVDITRGLKAQATVNTGTSANVTGSAAQVDRGSSIGLTYQFDY